MKTNLNRTIETLEDAKQFLQDLHANSEQYDIDSPAEEICWETTQVSPQECAQLDKLMAQVFSIAYAENFDPHGFLIDLDHANQEYFVRDNSGRGHKATLSYIDFKINGWDLDQVADDDENTTLADYLFAAEIGDEFNTENNETIIRVK